MKIKLILLSIVLMIFAGCNLPNGKAGIQDYAGESIIYLVSPFGKAEYNDLGVVDLKGVKVNLITFKTKVFLFEDTKKIYSDPKSLLPRKIERDISGPSWKEYITEECDQEKFTVVIRKFKAGKQVSEQTIKANGPIHNAILLPFYLGRMPGLEIGLRFTARLPTEFKVELISIDEIKVPAGKFQAYHFKSIPDKFEIWLNKDIPRVPLKIKGKTYSLLMKKHSFHNN